MQPSPSPPPPERRGRTTLIALLAVGFLLASAIAVIELAQLRAANERIEELEARGGQAEEDGGGLFGGVEDLLKDLLGDADATGDIGSLLDCLGTPFAGDGEAGTTVGAIAEQVEDIRELEFDIEVEPRFLGDDEMTARVRELFLEEYTPRLADLEERLLTALGAIPPGTDLRRLRADAIGEQVAGFYETETGELVVRRSGAGLSAIDRITVAHELDHALTDQALGIPLPDDPQIGREDANMAALALAEGDATLVMQRYSATLGFQEQFELLDPEAIAEAEAGLAGFPPYLEQELVFPYEEGLSFVCDLYAEGGWQAVNRAYDRPPTSTAQILFPERYFQEEQPVDPPDPPAPGRGWKELAKVQIGAANLLWLFSAPGGDASEAIDAPREEAARWRGGEATIWRRGNETGVSLVLSETRPDELCGAVREWYDRSFDDDEIGAALGTTTFDGPGQDAAVVCGSGQTTIAVGIGPDIDTAIGLAAVF